MSLSSEATLACTGVVKPKVDPEVLDKATTFEAEWREAWNTWVLEGTRKAWSAAKARDVAKLREQLALTVGIDDLVDAIPDELVAGEYRVELEAARASILRRYPLVTIQDGLGVHEVPPALDLQWDWLSVVQVVDAPWRLLELAQIGCLAPAEVEVFRENYPALYLVMDAATFDGMVDLRAKDPAELFPENTENMLRILRQVGFDQPLLPAEPAGPAAGAPRPTGTLKPDQELTSGQRVALHR